MQADPLSSIAVKENVQVETNPNYKTSQQK